MRFSEWRKVTDDENLSQKKIRSLFIVQWNAEKSVSFSLFFHIQNKVNKNNKKEFSSWIQESR